MQLVSVAALSLVGALGGFLDGPPEPPPERAPPAPSWLRPAEADPPPREARLCAAAHPSSRRRQVAWSVAAGLGAFVVGISWGRWLEGAPEPDDEPAARGSEEEPPRS